MSVLHTEWTRRQFCATEPERLTQLTLLTGGRLAGAMEADERFFSEVVAMFDGVEVEPHLLRGESPLESLKAFCVEKEIDLVVTSTHGWTGLKHVVMGSFAEKLVRNLSPPVLTYKARGEASTFDPRKVLVPFDFSENAGAVLPAIRMLSQSFLPEFKFVYVVETILDVWCAPDGVIIHSAVKRAAQKG